MQYLATTALVSFLLILAPAAAKHAECYWTGPGVGTPEQQGFSVFGTGKLYRYKDNNSRSVASYYCDDYADKPIVATWSILRPFILEMATPCGGNGYSGDCTFGLWGFKLNGYLDPKTGQRDPVRFLRKTDDCEWIYPIKEAEIPSTITIYHR